MPTVDHYESNLHLFAHSAFAPAPKAGGPPRLGNRAQRWHDWPCVQVQM